MRTLPDAEGVARAAADDFVAVARAAVEARGRFCVALSGGGTPRRLYALLGERRAEVAWERVECFWGDERAVPPGDPRSNYGLAARTLLDRVGVPAAGVHRIQAERPDLEAAAREYQAEIARAFGVSPEGPAPAFDLILLGLGADGHTASLFPRSPALRERRWVASHRAARPGTPRITFTPPLINRAREIRVLVTGAHKAAVLRAVLEGPREPERLPAQLLAPEAGHLVWLVDRAAARQLGAPA